MSHHPDLGADDGRNPSWDEEISLLKTHEEHQISSANYKLQ